MNAPSNGSKSHHRMVDVKDPSRILECVQLERRRCFQHLVRLYLSQILYGCKNAYCDTPTCLSCSRRNASKPFRPPTQLTARALAHYLASQDKPHRGLCPHALNVAPESFEIGGSAEDAKHNTPTHFMSERIRHGLRGVPVTQSVHRLDGEHQKKKDVKSLGQNLYDSTTIYNAQSKKEPPLDTVLQSLRIKEYTEVSIDHTQQEGVPATNQVPVNSEETKSPVLNDTASITQGLSKPRQRAPSVHKLSNGHEIHTIPFNPRHDTRQKRRRSGSHLAQEHSPPSRKPSVAKTGQKNSTLSHDHAIAERQIEVSTPRKGDGARSLAFDSAKPIIPMITSLDCNGLSLMKSNARISWDPQHGTADIVCGSNDSAHNERSDVLRSLFYVLSNPSTLLQSFQEPQSRYNDSPLPHLDAARLDTAFRSFKSTDGSIIFDSLCIATEALFIQPPELIAQKSPRLKPSRKAASRQSSSDWGLPHQQPTDTPQRYLSTIEAAHLIMVCVHALTSSLPCSEDLPWSTIRMLRASGLSLPSYISGDSRIVEFMDDIEYEPAVRLADRLLRGIGARICFEHILECLRARDDNVRDEMPLLTVLLNHLKVVEHIAPERSRQSEEKHYDVNGNPVPGYTVTSAFLEWLKTIIIKKWDGKAEINKWTSVGTAVMLMDSLHENANELGLHPEMLAMPFLTERLDRVEAPLEFLARESSPNQLHLLQYPSLLPMRDIISYFRTVNFTSMMKQYDHTTRIHQMRRSLDMFIREPFWWVIKSRMKVTLSDFLILEVSREKVLEDTLNQLWKQERRMLMKPLKVRMGQQEGEVGLDHGGVTYEFFRVVLREAFMPEYGMFTVDPQTHMTWFSFCTIEPMWKFEMLGLLFSLAVYNGITLPVTFPLALYHWLLPSEDNVFRNRHIQFGTVEFIEDGWSGLAKSFKDLLTWTDGDVGDVIMREYVFTYEEFGHKIDVDLTTRKQAVPGQEIPMVTNKNREDYVRDYIDWLTRGESINHQMLAFRKGFYTCLNKKSLHLFTPMSLRDLVEGTQDISIAELKEIVKYENGYSPTHRSIKDFWAIVESYSQKDCRRLLEFVTASDRVPVTGHRNIAFDISKIGGGPENLPTSSTCFGKLYLPEYPDRETLKKKLDLAIQNARGFGVV